MRKNFFKVAAFAFLMMVGVACQKEVKHDPVNGELISGVNKDQGHLKQTKTFSSDLVISWLNMQLQMLRLPLPAGTGSQGTDRSQAYAGIALYESVVPGMPAYRTLAGQLTNFPAMPEAENGKAYHWGASANAALAEIHRKMFPTTAAANKTRMDQLEDSLKAIFAAQVDAATLSRSIAFGREVATRVAAWAATDGSANINPAYVAPIGPGLWVPTAPTPAINPYAFQRRLLVPGSDAGTALVPPPPYSTSPTSAFYAMVKEVYDASKVLTTDQKAMADYYKDNPGYSPGGGFVSILSQAFSITHPTLDIAALTYVKVGLAQHESTIVLFTNKYQFNLIRPVTYIRNVIDPTWNTYIPTPNHPEFPSGHATTNGAVLAMMSDMFGENFTITLHTYDYLGYPTRTYSNWSDMGQDMANSRLYGGLHYKATCEKSLVQGKKVAQNILNNVHFLK